MFKKISLLNCTTTRRVQVRPPAATRQRAGGGRRTRRRRGETRGEGVTRDLSARPVSSRASALLRLGTLDTLRIANDFCFTDRLFL